MFKGLWATLFPKTMKVCREKTEKELYECYYNTDSMSYGAVILYKLLARKIPFFEDEIAKSVNYPHEVDWDLIGMEMFDLLSMCKKTLENIVTSSEVMEEYLDDRYKDELKALKETNGNQR